MKTVASTMHEIAVNLNERMLAAVPDEQMENFLRIIEIDKELRRTDVRLMDDPSDDQIQYFLDLIEEGETRVESFDQDNVHQNRQNDRILVINFLFNTREVLRCQKLRSNYTWRDRLQTDVEVPKDLEE